ncbi:MAG: hypothetical protein VB137_07155 [Burkholderia sp.]
MNWPLIKSAEKSWHRIRGVDKLEQLLKGIPFKDETPVIDRTPTQQPLAA